MLIIIDTETLANSANAAILSVGAIAFSHESGIDPIKFYSKIDLREQDGRMIDPNVVTCWMRRAQEDDHAIDVFDGEREPVRVVLEQLSTYIGAHLAVDGEVWGDGLDCMTIRTLYEEFGIATPWRNAQQRCVRTLRSLVMQLDIEINVSHDVSSCQELDDAEWNARFILAAVKSLHRRQIDRRVTI
ncbi:3'-5' exonuclease [Dyella nitratireducens]|uniref:Exodeoxyribonuclease VIII n=1 Tax=Dyella nitratireducens TaxID=1849580 RepID=A0ABQ1FN11_9GAMM|nr:3'-5' exonuclease [Dyella nitratireducens]GGA23257.1 exodeoxyribonuclease VIII [Dyella nitratireducens]GLQ43993.1 exodeoxyribonuclease VIII [Dyella nitratireducens]